MLIGFYDQSVDIKQVTIGCVVFVTDISDKLNKSKYVPAHVTGFHYNGSGELVIVVKRDRFCEDEPIHPGNLVWEC